MDNYPPFFSYHNDHGTGVFDDPDNIKTEPDEPADDWGDDNA